MRIGARRILVSLCIVPLGALLCSSAVSRTRDEIAGRFDGSWVGRSCARDDIACGSFDIVLVQRGWTICGSHASTTSDLSRIDEGEPTSIIGMAIGYMAVVVITSGRNAASYIVSIRMYPNQAVWNVITPLSVPSTGDSDLIPRTAIFHKVDVSEAIEQLEVRTQ